VAVTATAVETPTVAVVTVNVAVVLPAATVTDAGMLTTETLLLERLTAIPPLGAASLSVTVPVDELLPKTAAGLNVSEATVGTGTTVRLEDTVLPAYAADMSTFAMAVTMFVVTVNVADVAPCGTVTVEEPSVVVVMSLVVRVTCAPPLGAGPFRLTVPVDEVPPTTVEALRITEAIVTPPVAA